MASSHGVPRLEREEDVEKEQEQIREYRALIDQVNAKVRHHGRPLSRLTIQLMVLCRLKMKRPTTRHSH